MRLRNLIALLAGATFVVCLPAQAGAKSKLPELPERGSANGAKPAAATRAKAAALSSKNAPGIGAPPQSRSPAAAKDAKSPVAKRKPKRVVPTLYATINLTKQRMTVRSGGRTLHSWKISSGRRGYETPTGTFRPGWMARRWHSRKYDMAPMPYSVFFNGGIATHGTTSTGRLGRPASHGCIRLRTVNARAFYNLVRKHGKKRTRIAVVGKTPVTRYARKKTHRPARRSSAGRRYRTYTVSPGVSYRIVRRYPSYRFNAQRRTWRPYPRAQYAYPRTWSGYNYRYRRGY